MYFPDLTLFINKSIISKLIVSFSSTWYVLKKIVFLVFHKSIPFLVGDVLKYYIAFLSEWTWVSVYNTQTRISLFVAQINRFVQYRAFVNQRVSLCKFVHGRFARLPHIASGYNLEYVPEDVLGKEICRAALRSEDVDCTVLPYIPFPDIQKEGIQRFSDTTPAFVLYSFADISDAQMAKDAVKADAYCLQLVPDRLITAELCKTALHSPNADKTVLGFIPEKFRTPEIRKIAEDRFGDKPEQKELPPPPHKKGISM